jgi:hypothetical protein
MSIVNDCMVVNLQIGVWMGYRLDKSASAKVTNDAGAETDAARVNKHLIPKESLKSIVSAAGAVRNHFYDKTLPWKDNGDRLLTRKMYQNFVEEHGKLQGEFYAAVDTFLNVGYPKARDQASFRMGDLFNPADYPSSNELHRKFYISLDIDAVTEANDFRVQLSSEAEERAVRDEMERAMQSRISRAMGDVWTRLSTVLGHFAAKMSTDDIFRDSTVKNLEELVELLPALNVLDDPNLNAVTEDIARTLVGYTAKDLRANKATRTAVADEAKRIMEDMSGFMNAFGGSNA